MKVFIGEYVCGGGLLETSVVEVPVGLRREGAAMLSALVQDASRFAEVVVPVDPRLAPDFKASLGVDVRPVAQDQPLWSQWLAASQGCDLGLVVAPESDGILAQCVAMLRAGGLDVVAGSGDFLRVASDKVQTAKVLHAAGVNHPIYMAIGDQRFSRQLAHVEEFVVKPRDGCGTLQIERFRSLDQAVAALGDRSILQEWRTGRAISVALIASNNRHFFLPAVTQSFELSTNEYGGGCGPLCDDDQRRAMALATRAVAALPPTARGFIGLDLLLGDRPSEDVVIEINPRLTTSYVGLRRMTEANIAAHIVDLAQGSIACNVGVEQVSWTSEGVVTVRSDVATQTSAATAQ